MPPSLGPASGPSPPKRRKLMHTPDGFDNSKRAAAKAPARKFASAFDDPKRSKTTTTELRARNVWRAPVAETSKEAAASSSAHARVTRPTRILAIPQPVAGPSSPPELVQSPHASILAAHRGASPAPVKPPAKPMPKGSIQQFQPVLPPPAPPKDPPRNLRPMQPPPQLAGGRPILDPSKMKTILTTRVAVAMDPRTESGTDELLGIYLEQNTGTHVPPVERELQRGLKQSPEKASKSKSTKFTRGGLAERAQRIFAKHNTTLGLWYKDMELQAQRPQAHPRIAPDLCLRIVDVLYVSSVASLQRSQGVPRLCVARCVRAAPRGPREPEEVAAVLDFGNPGSAAARAHTLDDVKMERTLHIWRPWNAARVGDSITGSDDVRVSLFQLPVHCSILFCTRFRIIN